MSKKIICLALGAMLLALSFPAEAQQTGKVPRIGFLEGPATSPRIEALRQGLRELGYVEGQNIAIESRHAEGKRERLPDLAAELVRLKVDVIVTSGIPSSLAAKNATTSVPIVFAGISADPIATGLVTSLARPGGNVTGFPVLGPELSGKRVELLKETFPKLARLAILWNPATPGKLIEFKEAEAAAKSLRIQVQSVEVQGRNDFEGAFAAITKQRANGLLTIPDPLTNGQTGRIVDFATKSRLPAMFDLIEAVETGGHLMAYGADRLDPFRRAATYVDKILKGTKPVDLPVQQPMKFEFVINLKTAKQIGLTIPPNVLARADKVIK
jgi:putative ABC transport system substrate-binding protein